MIGAPDTDAANAATLANEEQAAAFVLPERGVNLEELERQLVVQALERCGWNQTRAATLLGLNRDQVRYRIEKFGLTASGRRATLSFSPTR